MIDPTYLRTIVDGLISGALRKDNPSALPEGIVGVYEEAIPAVTSVIERGKFLDFFSVWAMLKKEVSAEFVVSLLNGLSEEEVLAFISRYSKWFNSPASGLYALYHERFRAFVLQKISGSQLLEINNRVIKSCNDALTRQLKDEWERYALEFLSAHLLMPSLENNNRSNELKELAYNTTYWNRQIEVSKGFDWSKRLLNDMMFWASKYDDDQVIECALNKVDLHHMEQNDAPRIVELVAQNDIESALRRIEAFGGSDQEGIRRKFTLYMLCLMELTLLGSKDNPFRKTAIDSLLRHLDENLPTDYSVLNWNDFFPSYLMFQMACVWAELGLDYLMVYTRTDNWYYYCDWIEEKGPYTDLQFQVIKECALGIADESNICSALEDIALELSKQGLMEESLAIARGMLDEVPNRTLKAIALGLSKQRRVEESLDIARGISDDSDKSIALAEIAVELNKQGQVKESTSVMKESLVIARGIIDEDDKCSALKDIAVELFKQGQVEESASVMQESLAIARGISFDYWKSRALKDIAVELFKQGQLEESASVMQESLAIARGIPESELVYTENYDFYSRSGALKDIAVELSNQGQAEESASVLQESLASANCFPEPEKNSAMRDIAVELSKQGKVEESLAIADNIREEWDKVCTLRDIAVMLIKHGKLDESLAVARNYFHEETVLLVITGELSKHDKSVESASVMQESLAIARGISSDWRKSSALKDIAVELSKQGQLEESLAIARGISNDFYRSIALRAIAVELSNQGQVEESSSVMQESLAIARGISDEDDKCSALKDIAVELFKQGQMEESESLLQESLAIARGIKKYEPGFSKCSALTNIAVELSKQGQVEESASVMQESLAIARGISNDYWKSSALKDIAVELFKQGQMEESESLLQESLAIARGINDENYKCALTNIAVALSKMGQVEESASVMQESLAIARGISNDYWKSRELTDIAVELFKQGQMEESESLLQESLAISRGLPFSGDEIRIIAMELSKQGNWTAAESVLLEVSRAGERHEGWQEMAKAVVEAEGWQKALRQAMNFQSEEARLFYRKGWSKQVGITDVDDVCVREALPLLGDDPESIQSLLEKYSIRLVSMGTPTKALVGRLNRALNIQWLLDITAKYPNSATHDRLSTNLEEWLHEIPDEDDREQITLWARQVVKGRLTESEFAERLKDINRNHT